MNFIKKNILVLLGLVIGAMAGYYYWQIVGCNSGSCAITSRPLNSTVYGAVMGGLIFSMFRSKSGENKKM